MKRSLTVVLVAALAAMTAPIDVSAQVSIGVAGGVTFPLGDYADLDGANTGWMGAAGVSFAVGEAGLSVGAAGFYGSNNHDIDGDKTNLLGGLGLVTYNISTGGSITPFVGASAGYLRHSYKSDTQPSLEGSVSGFAYGARGGISFPLGGMNGFLQGNWLKGAGDVSGTQWFGVTAGVLIPVGGSGM